MSHLKNLKYVNFAIGAYTFLIGLLVFVLWVIPGLWGWQDGEDKALLLVAIGVLCFLLIGGIGAAHVIVGYLVGSGRARAAQTALATMQLMSFPVGTAYALYALWVCWTNEESSAAFEKTVKPKVS